MAQRPHVIELALDFARMPALARTSVTPPIPADIVEIMRIAAASPKACQDAAKATGESAQTLIDAARFYLQQVLFRPDADCHRILGLQLGASRATARTHMRWLLQWLHPDRNDGLDAVYAERVVKAWREMSASSQASAPMEQFPQASGRSGGRMPPFRVPWIKYPVKAAPGRRSNAYLAVAVWAIPGLVLALMALWSALYFFGLGPTTAVVVLP